VLVRGDAHIARKKKRRMTLADHLDLVCRRVGSKHSCSVDVVVVVTRTRHVVSRNQHGVEVGFDLCVSDG